MKIGFLVVAFVLAFLFLIAYSTIHGARFRVNVCMAYAGRSACRTVSAKSEEAALRSASENACADIASGVTDTIKCEKTDPQSVRWLQRPSK